MTQSRFLEAPLVRQADGELKNQYAISETLWPHCAGCALQSGPSN